MYGTCLGTYGQNRKVEIVKFEHLQKVLNQVSDTTVVLHFWATWCRPCMEELLFFEELSTTYNPQKIKFILVSMDFVKDAETSLKNVIERNKIKSKVVLLDEPDYNSWIDLIDKEWSGTIPATLVLNANLRKRKFYEGKVNMTSFSDELKKMCPVTIQN
ncbi:TlpA disulfide reductase family protein [Arcicella rosea]|nr:TlpA disulfide reductase family protein [Arcicella rosea]